MLLQQKKRRPQERQALPHPHTHNSEDTNQQDWASIRIVAGRAFVSLCSVYTDRGLFSRRGTREFPPPYASQRRAHRSMHRAPPVLETERRWPRCGCAAGRAGPASGCCALSARRDLTTTYIRALFRTACSSSTISSLLPVCRHRGLHTSPAPTLWLWSGAGEWPRCPDDRGWHADGGGQWRGRCRGKLSRLQCHFPSAERCRVRLPTLAAALVRALARWHRAQEARAQERLRTGLSVATT